MKIIIEINNSMSFIKLLQILMCTLYGFRRNLQAYRIDYKLLFCYVTGETLQMSPLEVSPLDFLLGNIQD